MNHHYTCLVVEDDPEDQEIFSLALEDVQLPVQCIFISNAAQAIEDLKEGRIHPDYIFLDLNMPRINGFECLQQIKRIPQMELVPVVIYSTSGESIYREEAHRKGATAFITKPARISEFSNVLRDFFKHTSASS